MKHAFTRQLLKQIKGTTWQPCPDLIYHDPNERNPGGHGWTIDECLSVRHRRADYGIRICQVKATSPVQVFVARIEGKEGTSNNYHVSFSSQHIDEYSVIFAEPSLIRCVGKQLRREPSRIGNYPARVAGTKSRYLLGRLDDRFLPRLFSLVNAKFDSLP